MGNKRCQSVLSIETLSMITELPGKSTRISRERVSLLNNLITILLDVNYNQEEAARIIEDLKIHRCPIPKIQTRMLSVMAFHEAMNLPNWQSCRLKWLSACNRLEINEFSAGQAISVGENIRNQFCEKCKGKKKFKDEVRKEVQKVFFGSKRVIKLLTSK